MAPMATTEHYTKDDRGRWVVQFGRHRGKRLGQIPSSYLRWLLRNVEFAVGHFRRAVPHVIGLEVAAESATHLDSLGGYGYTSDPRREVTLRLLVMRDRVSGGQATW